MWDKGANNIVEIVGTLNETKFEINEEVAKATIFVKVNQKIGNEVVSENIPVQFYSKKMTKATDSKPSSINPSYQSLVDAQQNFVSVAACGNVEGASRVYIKGNLSENLFYTKTGVFVSEGRVKASFIYPARENAEDKADFIITGVVGDYKPELTRTGEETGNVVLNLLVPQYINHIDKISFSLTDDKLKAHAEKFWIPHSTIAVKGLVNYSFKVIEKIDDACVGDPIIKRETVTVKELIISGGHGTPLTEDEGKYEDEDVTTALAERQNRIREAKDKIENKTPSYNF